MGMKLWGWIRELVKNPRELGGKGKDEVNHAAQASIGCAHLPLPGLEPVGGEPLM